MSPASSDRPSDAFIAMKSVTKEYTMGETHVRALDQVDLDIEKGRFITVTGPSGSGKSTLLHLLAALDVPTDGWIRVGDWTLDDLDRTEQARYRRSMVGIIFQQFHLVPTMTAQENVALPMVLAGASQAHRRERAAECLEMVELGDRMDHRPAELSGGEQQRVATARALVSDPPVVLADEPTGNLDSETGGQIVDLLARINREQERTVVVVTHHPEEVASVTERTVRLHDGRLRAPEPARS